MANGQCPKCKRPLVDIFACVQPSSDFVRFVSSGAVARGPIDGNRKAVQRHHSRPCRRTKRKRKSQQTFE